MELKVPSVYWPIAEMGFSRNRKLRGIFHLLFCRLYRKRFWNPLMNSWARNKGFNRRRHLFACNTHAVCSWLVLFLIGFYLHFAHRAATSGIFKAERNCYIWIVVLAAFELIFNTPAIILSRYLYLLTIRRPGLTNKGVQSQ